VGLRPPHFMLGLLAFAVVALAVIEIFTRS
jgi:hypothetical protein